MKKEELGIVVVARFMALCLIVPIGAVIVCWMWFSLPAGWWPIVPFLLAGGYIMIRDRHTNKEVQQSKKALDEIEHLERLYNQQ